MYKVIFKDMHLEDYNKPTEVIAEAECPGCPSISTGHSDIAWITPSAYSLEISFRKLPDTITLFGQYSIYINGLVSPGERVLYQNPALVKA